MLAVNSPPLFSLFTDAVPQQDLERLWDTAQQLAHTAGPLLDIVASFCTLEQHARSDGPSLL